MLTWDDLEAHRLGGRLILWDPRKRGITPDGRALYMVPAVWEAVQQRPWPAIRPGESRQRTADRRAAMRNVLERFISGGNLTLNHDIAEMGSKLRRPAHRGHWEFRSVGPAMQTRIFGFFARPGAFVAFDFLGRDEVDYPRQFAADSARWCALTFHRPTLNSPYPVDTPADLAVYLQRADDA